MSEQGKLNVSSRNLSDVLGVNPWQVRKDFSYFGDFGTRGVGYEIKKLTCQIYKILKLDVVRQVALVGVGNLGSAVLAYPGFREYGFEITAVFDNNSEKIGRKIKNIVIEDVSTLLSLKSRGINLGIITVGRNAAQETADALVNAGIKGVLNFSPCYITTIF